MENTALSNEEIGDQMIKGYHKGQPYAIMMLFGVVVSCFVVSLAVIAFVVTTCSILYDLFLGLYELIKNLI